MTLLLIYIYIPDTHQTTYHPPIQVLLTMKHTALARQLEGDNGQQSPPAISSSTPDEAGLARGFVDRPLTAMLPQLELFVDFSAAGACDAGALQAVLPYALIHHGVVDVSLGRLYGDDARGGFRHPSKMSSL